MRLPSSRFTVLGLALTSCLSFSCKPRASLEEKDPSREASGLKPANSGSEDADPAIELERLRLSNQETLNTLQIESIANEKRLLELSNELTRISIQLNDQGLSDADRMKYQSQQTSFQSDRTKLEQTQQVLKAKIAALKPKVEDIDTRIITLADELELLSPEEAKALWPRIKSLSKEISELKNLQVSGGSGTTPTPSVTPTTTPTTTPSPTLPKGTLSSVSYNFYYEEVGVKKDCIDIAAASVQSAASTIAAPCAAGRKSQVFKLENFADQSFRMIAQHSNLCLYVVAAAKTANAALEQHSCSDPTQVVNAMIFKFREIDTDKGTFKLQNLNSNLCLKINTDGRIIQGECNVSFTLFQTSTVSP